MDRRLSTWPLEPQNKLWDSWLCKNQGNSQSWVVREDALKDEGCMFRNWYMLLWTEEHVVNGNTHLNFLGTDCLWGVTQSAKAAYENTGWCLNYQTPQDEGPSQGRVNFTDQQETRWENDEWAGRGQKGAYTARSKHGALHCTVLSLAVWLLPVHPGYIQKFQDLGQVHKIGVPFFINASA